MQIKKAEFLTSSAHVNDFPDSDFPEFAFIGRSNVGKSSLINMLTGRKNLAKTSGTPGKTQLINHFVIDERWYLVDLPGYGYARVSKTDRKKFQRLINAYFANRQQLVSAFVLIDSRHAPQPIDLQFINWLGENGVPFSIIFTKADKLKPAVLEKNTEAYRNKLLETWEEPPTIFVTSSVSGRGREEVLEYIGRYIP